MFVVPQEALLVSGVSDDDPVPALFKEVGVVYALGILACLIIVGDLRGAMHEVCWLDGFCLVD